MVFSTLMRGLAAFGGLTSRAWLLTVAGAGPERKIDEALATELKCGGSVSFLGPVDNERVGRRRQHDLTTVCSRAQTRTTIQSLPDVVPAVSKLCLARMHRHPHP